MSCEIDMSQWKEKELSEGAWGLWRQRGLALGHPSSLPLLSASVFFFANQHHEPIVEITNGIIWGDTGLVTLLALQAAGLF